MCASFQITKNLRRGKSDAEIFIGLRLSAKPDGRIRTCTTALAMFTVEVSAPCATGRMLLEFVG
jgi:hypothetical protein